MSTPRWHPTEPTEYVVPARLAHNIYTALRAVVVHGDWDMEGYTEASQAFEELGDLMFPAPPSGGGSGGSSPLDTPQREAD